MKAQEAMSRTREVIRRQHKALATEESYLHWLNRYIAALRQMPNELPSEKKVERFLTALALRRDVAASTQNLAFNELRHAYATHCLDRGVNVKALQEAMGHEQIETTIGYCHAEARWTEVSPKAKT